MNDQDERDIAQLVRRFADACCVHDFEAFASLWADRATWVIDPPVDTTLTGSPVELTEAVKQSIQQWIGFAQLVHGTVVTSLCGDHATARSYLTEVGQMAGTGPGYFNHGMYRDELLRTSHGWRFSQRHYHYLYLDQSPLSGQMFPPPDVTTVATATTVGTKNPPT